MALEFRPPEELVRDYMNRPSPGQLASEGVNKALQTYALMKQQEQQKALQTQQLALLQHKDAREGQEQFYNYGDIAGLPQEVQPQIGKPAQGPANYIPPENIPYEQQQQGVLGQAQGPVQPTGALSQPQVSPLIQRYNDFLKQNPEGIKGRERKEKLPQNVPLYTKQGKLISTLLPNAKVIDEDGPTRSPQYVGTQPNNGVIFDPNMNNGAGGLRTTPLPGGGSPISPRTAPTVPADQVNKNAEMEKMLADINVIKTTKQPGFIGMVDSPMTAVKQATGIGATPEAATFKSTVAGLRNKVLNMLSGAAISPAEYQRLLNALPDEAKSEVDFDAKLANFERETRLIMQQRQQAFNQAGYGNTGGMAPSASPNVPQAGGWSYVGQVGQ